MQIPENDYKKWCKSRLTYLKKEYTRKANSGSTTIEELDRLYIEMREHEVSNEKYLVDAVVEKEVVEEENV